MPTRTLTGTALINALAAAAYTALIGLLLSHGEALFGAEDGPLTITAILLTLVVSTAVMAVLIFGKPVLWYLDGDKQGAVRLLLYTIGFLVVIAATVFTALAVY